MKIGIMQPYFFPYIAYWQLINAVDKYVIYDDVNYIKNGWINRNYILLNGQKHLVTLPLEGASSFELIKNTKITSNNKVKEKLLRTIKNSYLKAPYINDVFPIIEKTVLEQSCNISKALEFSIREVANYLNIHTEIILSSTLSKNENLNGQDKVINIVKMLNGTSYINAIGGLELYSKETFAKENINLNFLRTREIQYKQFNNDFVPNLSIIDVMMFNSPETIREMLDDYELL